MLGVHKTSVSISFPQNASQTYCLTLRDHLLATKGNGELFPLHENLFMIIRTGEFAV